MIHRLLHGLTSRWEDFRQRQRTPPPDLYALVRIRSETSILEHIQSMGPSLMAVMTFFVVSFTFLGLDFVLLDKVLRSTTSMPLLLWLAWLQGTYRGPLVVIPADAWQRYVLWGEIIGTVQLFFFGGVGLLLEYAYREVRNFLHRVHHGRNPTSSDLLASTLLNLRFPAGFRLEIIDAPSLTSVLDQVQQTARPSRSLSELWVTAAQDTIEDPTPTSLRFRVMLTHLMQVVVLGPNGEQVTCTFKNATWSSLLAYLSMQPWGAWVPEDTLLQDVYGKAKPEQLSLCRLQMRRIKEELIAWAQEGDILPETMGKDEKDALGLLLFEHEVKGRDHSWRLLPSCEVEVFPRLEPLYQELAAGHPPHIDLFQAYQSYAAMVEEYGHGFLADHQPQIRTWRWAKPFYLLYQRRVLQVLEAAVTREQETLAPQLPTSEQRLETLGRLAHLYCWYALAAIGLLPQQPQAEQALQQALHLFFQCHDLTGAEDLYQDFAQAWENRGEIWKPQEDTANLWAQVVAQQQAAMNRKSKKAAPARAQKTNLQKP